MSNGISMAIIAVHLILAGLLKVWESTTQEHHLKTISIALGIFTLVIGLGLLTRRKFFIFSSLVIILLPLLLMPFVVAAYFPMMKFACIGLYIFFVPLFMWEFSVLRRELKNKFNHNLQLASSNTGGDTNAQGGAAEI